MNRHIIHIFFYIIFLVINLIYIDEYIIINFIIDYIILKTDKTILKINVLNRRIILACIVSNISIITLFVNFNYLLSVLLKLLVGFLIIIISFGYKDFKTFIINFFYYHIVNFFLGGILFYFKSEGVIKYKYYLLFVPIIMNIYKHFSYNLKNIISFKYKVQIYLNNGKILYLNGFMDSANTLVEPYNNKKVIIINKDVSENCYLVPFKTINDVSLIRCFTPKCVYIDGIGKRNDISVGIVNRKFKGYDCLLNYKILEDI